MSKTAAFMIELEAIRKAIFAVAITQYPQMKDVLRKREVGELLDESEQLADIATKMFAGKDWSAEEETEEV